MWWNDNVFQAARSRGWPKYEERVSDTREQILGVLYEDSGIYTLHILINLVWKCPAAMWILHINQHNKSLHHFKAVRYSGLSQCFISSPGKSPIPPVDEAALTVTHLLNNGRQEHQEVVSVTWLLQFHLCSSITAWRKKNAFMVHFQNGRHSPHVVPHFFFFSVTMKYIAFFSWVKVFHFYIKSSCRWCDAVQLMSGKGCATYGKPKSLLACERIFVMVPIFVLR